MLHIYIDADACPVKDEVYRVARRCRLPVTLVANSWMRVPGEDWIALEVVGDASDEADDWIVDHVEADDIVITADIPLADRCLKEGAKVLGPTGKPFSEDNIGSAVATRDLLSELRGAGEITGGPPPLMPRDRSLFLQQLDKVIQAIRRKQPIDWSARALDSEIALSSAYGGVAREHSDCIHIRNPAVPWCGDYNRTVGVRVADLTAFDRVVARIERLHTTQGLDRPDRFDIAPPTLDGAEWEEGLTARGFRMSTAVFFRSNAAPASLPPGAELRLPSIGEYIDWYRDLVKARGYYEDDWFLKARPLQERFARVFRPHWLLADNELAAWVHVADLPGFRRLFDLEVVEHLRGRGLGSVLLGAVRTQSVLLQSSEDLRGFYERAGYTECAQNTVIRRRVS